MVHRARHAWGLLTAEGGQSLVVVIVSLGVLVGMAAFGIDTATWMVKRHHDQVVADAAALAAANCLAHPSSTPTSMVINGSQTSVPACSTGSDATDATTVAVDYAAANGLTIATSNVNVDTKGGTVTVTAPSTSPGFFARLFGIDQASQLAAATASWRSGLQNCTNPGSNSACGFLFANDSSCSSSSGITLSNAGTVSVTGTSVSNGNLGGRTNGTVSLGTASYGPGSGCENNVQYNGHNPWSSPPTQASQVYSYPINYANDFPACGSSNDPCQGGTGPLAGYPSFCTNAAQNITLGSGASGGNPVNDNVYCASGTGKPFDPSTWNGTITISLSSNQTLYDTFVGGSISFSGIGNSVLSACGYAAGGYVATNCAPSVPPPATANYPLFYATDTPTTTPSGTTALSVSVGGTEDLYGDMAALYGDASLTMTGTPVLTSFVEALDINATMRGTAYGDGPVYSGSGGYTAGIDSLTQ